MTAVFDAHVHCFPPLSEDTGDIAARLAETQHHIRFAGATDIRRTRNDAPIGEPVLVGEGDGISRLPNVDFRIGRYGRVEFTIDGEDYYYQLFTPSLWDNSCPADYMITQMDYAGVDRALLQSDRMYGRLDDFLADCIRRYPDRLVALAQVDEWRGGSPKQVERVRRQIEEYGFSGLYFSTSGFFHCDFEFGVNDPEPRAAMGTGRRIGGSRPLVFGEQAASANGGLSQGARRLRPLGQGASGHTVGADPRT